MPVACPWGIFEWCEEGGNYNVYKLSEIKEPRKAFNEYKLGEVVSATFNRGKRAFPAKIQGISENKAQLEQDYLEGRQHVPATHSDSETDSETEPVEWHPLSASVTHNVSKSKTSVNGSAAPRREASAKATSSKTAKDGSLADHDRKRIHQLEETVKAIEKSYKSLKKRMRTLEDAPAEEMCNGQTITSLEASVSHLAAGEKDLLEVVKILALKVFSADELRTHSLTGKKTCKVSPGDPRPALDQARFQQLEQQLGPNSGTQLCTTLASGDTRLPVTVSEVLPEWVNTEESPDSPHSVAGPNFGTQLGTTLASGDTRLPVTSERSVESEGQGCLSSVGVER
ncbi:hypothetical protein JOQ06_023462, partial [Pogonophryne albipinna]